MMRNIRAYLVPFCHRPMYCIFKLLYEGGSRRLVRVHWAHLTFLALFAIYIFNGLIMYLVGVERYPVYRYEPALFYATHHQRIYGTNFMALIFWALLSFTYFYHLVFLGTKSHNWSFFYELSVLARDYFDHCRIGPYQEAYLRRRRSFHIKRYLNRYGLPSLLVAPAERILWLLRCDSWDRSKMLQFRFRHLPGMPLNVRIQLYLFIRLFDWIVKFFIVGTVIFLIFFWVVYLPLFWKPFPFYYLPVILLEVIFFVDATLLTILIFLNVIYCAFIAQLTQLGCIKHIDSWVSNILFSIKIRAQCANQNVKLTRLPQMMSEYQHMLRQLYVNHGQICYQIRHINQELLSKAAIALLVINIPINMYSLYRVAFVRRLQSMEYVAFVAILLGQYLAVPALLLPLGRYPIVVHRTRRLLPALIALLHHNSIRLKLQYQMLFERLSDTSQLYGVSFGSLDTINHAVGGRIFLSYLCYFFFIYSLVHNNNDF